MNDHLDFLLDKWPFDPDGSGVRLIKGANGRDVIRFTGPYGDFAVGDYGQTRWFQTESYATLLDSLLHQEADHR